MTKAEVVDLVSQKTGMQRQQAYDAVEIFLKCIKDALRNGEKASLVGFGTFILRQKRPRRGRNPRTGDFISVPPKAIPAFKPGKAFRDAVEKK